MQSEIRHNPDFGTIRVQFDQPGEQVVSESGAMVARDTAITMETNMRGGLGAALKRKLLRAVLAPRGRIVWACNPMTIPGPRDLPSADQEDVKRLDIRVLANEWESAALVVTNLAKQTLDGQVPFRYGVCALVARPRAVVLCQPHRVFAPRRQEAGSLPA